MRGDTDIANIRILAVVAAAAAAAAMFPHHRAVPRRPVPHPPAKPNARVCIVDPAVEAAALGWAERLLADAPERLPRPEDDKPLLWTARDARDAFSHIIAKFGPSPRAEQGLGKSCLRLGLYRDAVAAFSRAVRFRSAAGEAASWLRKASLMLQVSREVQPMLPRGSTVLRVRAFPAPIPGRSWLVLSGIMDPNGDRQPAPHTIILSLFNGKVGSYRRVWQSEPIARVDGNASDDVWAADLIVESLHSGAVPQVLVYELYPAGDCEPEHVSVWAWAHGGIAAAGTLDSIDGMWEGRIERGGQRAIFITNRIDSATCEAQKPRWTDAYTWQDGRLQPCDRPCPQMVREAMRQLRVTLRNHPGDPITLCYLGASNDLLGYHHRAVACYRAGRKGFHLDADPAGDLADLGHVYDIAGRPALAIQAYRAAKRECLNKLERTKNPEERSYMEGDLARVRRRLAAGASPAYGWVAMAND